MRRPEPRFGRAMPPSSNGLKASWSCFCSIRSARPVIDSVFEGLAKLSRSRRQSIVVAYLNPLHAERVERLTGVRRQPMSLARRLRFAALSPYRLNIYRMGD